MSQTIEYADTWRYYIHLDVGNLDDDFLELVVLPSVSRPLDHGKGGIVLLRLFNQCPNAYRVETGTYKFFILDVQEDKFGPKVCTLGGLDDLGDVDAGDEKLKMLHDYCNSENKTIEQSMSTYASRACTCCTEWLTP